MQMTSEDYFGSIALVRASAKNRSSQNVEKVLEAAYPSSLLEPNKLQSTSRHFESSLVTSFERDWAVITPGQAFESEWSLSRLYSNQCVASVEAIGERVVNSLQSIPAGQRIQVYEFLLDKLEQKVREYVNKGHIRHEVSATESNSEMIGRRDKKGADDRYQSEIGASAESYERPLYERVSAEMWSALFQQWAADHRERSYEVDDSRDAIYEDRDE